MRFFHQTRSRLASTLYFSISLVPARDARYSALPPPFIPLRATMVPTFTRRLRTAVSSLYLRSWSRFCCPRDTPTFELRAFSTRPSTNSSGIAWNSSKKISMRFCDLPSSLRRCADIVVSTPVSILPKPALTSASESALKSNRTIDGLDSGSATAWKSMYGSPFWGSPTHLPNSEFRMIPKLPRSVPQEPFTSVSWMRRRRSAAAELPAGRWLRSTSGCMSAP